MQPYAKTVDVNQQLDKKVNTADMRKPASDVAGIDEVNAKQDKIGYTPADDSKVVHISGTEEIADQKTFDIAPIDKTTGNPYITKDGVPSIPSDVARTGQSQTFTAAQTFSSAPTVTDTSSSKGDNQVALMGDLKSLEASAWRQLDASCVTWNDSGISMKNISILAKINQSNKTVQFMMTANVLNHDFTMTINLSSIINGISQVNLTMSYGNNIKWEAPTFSGTSISIYGYGNGVSDWEFCALIPYNSTLAQITYTSLK